MSRDARRPLIGQQQSYDVLTERRVERFVFTEPRSWEKPATVNANQRSVVNFVISNSGNGLS